MAEKLRTEDIIECSDEKILTSSSHPLISVGSGATYDQVLSAMDLQVLTLPEKAAISWTISTASSSNPVVLKTDISAYYPVIGTGSIKDSVPTYGSLPTTVPPNEVGDMRMVLDENTIYLCTGLPSTWSAYLITGTQYHTQLYNYNTDASYHHLAQSEKTILLSQSHSHSNKSTVLDLIAAPGSGLIMTAVDRAKLPTVNESDALGYYLSIPDPSLAIDPVLDLITYASHGFIDGDTVQFFPSNGANPSPLLATSVYYVVNSSGSTFQVSGSSGGTPIDILTAGSGFIKLLDFSPLSPTAINRLVTTVDPRLNTLRNPYITLGPVSTSPPPTFFGTDITDIMGSVPLSKEGAIPALKQPFGTSSHVRALQILPGVISSPGGTPAPYDLNAGGSFDPIVWSASSSAVFTTVASPYILTFPSNHGLESGTPVWFQGSSLPSPLVGGLGYGIIATSASTIQVYQTNSSAPLLFTTAGSGTLEPESNLLLDGMFNATFRQETYTDSVQIQGGREGFTLRGLTIETVGSGTNGPKIQIPKALIEEYTFTGTVGQVGLTIQADDVTIRRCRFLGGLDFGLKILGNNVRVEECFFFNTGTQLTVEGGLGKIDSCVFSSSDIIIASSASNTLLAQNLIPGFIIDNGFGTRLVTTVSFEYGQPTLALTKTIGPPGSRADYRGTTDSVFSNAFSDPHAKDFVVLPGAYTFSSPVTIPSSTRIRGEGGVYIDGLFNVGGNVQVEDLWSHGTGLKLNCYGSDSSLKHCQLSRPTGLWSLGLYSVERIKVSDCSFTGTSGIYISNTCNDISIVRNTFQTTGLPLSSDCSGRGILLKGNWFLGQTPTFPGSGLYRIEGNWFTGPTPQLRDISVDSYVGGNWPEYIKKDRDTINPWLRPIEGTGAERARFVDVGCLAFLKGSKGTATTLQTPVPYPLNSSGTCTLSINWTSSVLGAGATRWEATLTFVDRTASTLSSPLLAFATSPRTKYTTKSEDTISFTFPSGLGGLLAPTHFFLTLRRLSDDPLDTLSGTAYLTDAKLEVPIY